LAPTDFAPTKVWPLLELDPANFDEVLESFANLRLLRKKGQLPWELPFPGLTIKYGG